MEYVFTLAALMTLITATAWLYELADDMRHPDRKERSPLNTMTAPKP